MKGTTSRVIIGMVLAWTIAFEGFFALSIANTATIDGIGGIRASTFTIAAVQLAGLGVLVSAVWVLMMIFPDLGRHPLVRLLSIITYAISALVAIEGLAISLMAGDVTVTGFGGVGKRWIALIGAQLFTIGILSLRYWHLRNVQPKNAPIDLLGSMVAGIMCMEGVTVIGIAANTTIAGFGTLLGRTILIAGAQLLVIGLIAFLVWTLIYDPRFGERISRWLSEKRSLIFMTLLGAIVCAEAVIASTVAGNVYVDGSSGAYKIYVVAGIAQLFALGMTTPILWKLRSLPLDRSFILAFLTPFAMGALAFEGIFAMALAANTFVEGIGWIMESTFRMAGAQLLVLSAIGLLAWLVKDSSYLAGWSKRIVSLLPLLSMFLIGLEGLAVIVVSGNIRIDDFGGVREKFVVLGGVQMALLASLAMTSWPFSGGLSARFKAIGASIGALIILMLPFALLI